jgi:hypothetical protein
MKFPVNLKPAPDRITTPKEYNLAGWMFYYGQACKPVLEGRGLRNQRRHGPFPLSTSDHHTRRLLHRDVHEMAVHVGPLWVKTDMKAVINATAV